MIPVKNIINWKYSTRRKSKAGIVLYGGALSRGIDSFRLATPYNNCSKIKLYQSDMDYCFGENLS